MSHKKRGALTLSIFAVSTMLLSACQQSLSSAPPITPTIIPTGLFVSPIPSAQNPMAVVEQFAKQTAAVQTAAAGGGASSTPQAIVTAGGASVTPQPGGAAITPIPNTPTNAAVAVATTPANLAPSSASNVTPGVRPATYVLQEGEFFYCIARRFDVDPDQLISASQIADPNNVYAGLKLTIPQSGHFPGDRALASHPTTYNVLSAAETLYSIACKYGDVYPEAIASANGISVSAKLTAGQPIKIP